MAIKYEIVENDRGDKSVNAFDEETGLFMSIPTDPANSDYQAYLTSLETAKK